MHFYSAFFIRGDLWGIVVNCGTFIANNHYFK